MAPAGGRNGTLNNGAIGNASGFARDTPDGVFTGTAFSFDEVGAIRLRASVADADYMGSGAVSGGVSGIVGRFRPDHFDVTSNVPRFATGCGVGAFTWMGQPFGFRPGEEAVLTVRAANAANATTANYAGDWWKITNSALQNRNYAVGSSTLDQSGLPATSADPAIASNGDGTGTLTFSTGSGLRSVRTTPTAPFDAEIALSIDVLDTDGTSWTANPFTLGGTTASNGIAFDISKRFQFGRIQIGNSHGSERVDLPVSLRTQRFDGLIFIDDDYDSCSAISTTHLMLSPTPGTLSTSPNIPNSPLLSGASGLFFDAPDTTGTVDIMVNLGPSGAGLPWLQYDWPADGNLDGAFDDDPSARITFGIWEGRDSLIYLREAY